MSAAENARSVRGRCRLAVAECKDRAHRCCANGLRQPLSGLLGLFEMQRDGAI